MVPFHKTPLTDLVIEGIVNGNKLLEECSAQESFAALMLHHSHPELMHRVLSDLAVHQNCCNSFVIGLALPSTKSSADPGSLVFLRDLWTDWGVDTLYLLAPFFKKARSLLTAQDFGGM
ncbi:MAG: hypothetical protein NW224_01205 [Leptolyngbyaceae cyanobacterium bins.302]|nr:hypothetical protein [Leptolyngbyaceae cyanobacterium bins.302]